jgi:hypothetical protein
VSCHVAIESIHTREDLGTLIAFVEGVFLGLLAFLDGRRWRRKRLVSKRNARRKLERVAVKDFFLAIKYIKNLKSLLL